MRQKQRQRQRPQHRDPDDPVSPDLVAHDAPDQRAHRGGQKEDEQHHLRRGDRKAEPLHQVKRVKRAEAFAIGVLGEHQQGQHHQPDGDGHRGVMGGKPGLVGAGAAGREFGADLTLLAADPDQ
ncbi:hypothetical protein D9M70_618330 [compost metagenome]